MYITMRSALESTWSEFDSKYIISYPCAPVVPSVLLDNSYSLCIHHIHIVTSQRALEVEGELLCFVGALTCKRWLHITSGITPPVCHQPNTGRAEWNTAGTGIDTAVPLSRVKLNVI